MKDEQFIEDVYNTLEGCLVAAACVPGVENLYAEGKHCMELYAEIQDAYGRLCDRLGVQDEDADVEIITNRPVGNGFIRSVSEITDCHVAALLAMTVFVDSKGQPGDRLASKFRSGCL